MSKHICNLLLFIIMPIAVLLSSCNDEENINSFDAAMTPIITEERLLELFDNANELTDPEEDEAIDSSDDMSMEIIDSFTSDVSEVFSQTPLSSDVSIDSVIATDSIGNTVWIPKSGKKYHTKPTCSNMKSPTEVTIDEAKSMGYEPCKRCSK